jgi:hypothetical protein
MILEYGGETRPDQHIRETEDRREEGWGANGGCFEVSLLHRPPHDAAAVLNARRSALQSPCPAYGLQSSTVLGL